MKFILPLLMICMLTFNIHAEEGNFLDEFDPNAQNAQEVLKQMDQEYFEATGKSPFLEATSDKDNCFRNSCSVWANVSKDKQSMELYINGVLQNTWPVSTGKIFHTTPDLDRHPDGRLYDAHTSSKYPGGNYNGLGNMPYAVFIEGGIAIHGTTKGNWSKLGTKDSHGCVRLHPDNAKIFIELVRKYGINDVWVTIE